MHLLPSLVPLSLGYQHGKATVRAKACGHAWASARASSDANLYPGLFATALKYDDALTCPFNHSPPDLTLRRYPKHGLRGIGLAPSICKISNHRLRSASKFHSGLSPTPTISSRASQLLADLSTKTAVREPLGQVAIRQRFKNWATLATPSAKLFGDGSETRVIAA